MPLSRAAVCAAVTCSSAIHCSQHSNSNHVGMIAHEFGHFRRITVRLREPCALPWGAPHLEGHRPRGECAQIRAGRLLERFECGLTLGGTRHLEHELQRLALVPPRGVDVEFVGIVVGGSDFGVQALDFGQRALSSPAYSSISCGRM